MMLWLWLWLWLYYYYFLHWFREFGYTQLKLATVMAQQWRTQDSRSKYSVTFQLNNSKATHARTHFQLSMHCIHSGMRLKVSEWDGERTNAKKDSQPARAKKFVIVSLSRNLNIQPSWVYVCAICWVSFVDSGMCFLCAVYFSLEPTTNRYTTAHNIATHSWIYDGFMCTSISLWTSRVYAWVYYTHWSSARTQTHSRSNSSSSSIHFSEVCCSHIFKLYKVVCRAAVLLPLFLPNLHIHPHTHAHARTRERTH